MTNKTENNDQPKVNKEYYASNNEVRWCPGCGDYAILTQMKKMLSEEGYPRENIVYVSGIGCSSRFPYYMSTYGFHGIHGRAPAIATGIKIANPDLKVFVITGDGDGLSIGGNHFLHMCRRNPDLAVILFNNRIYGLTKGQYSPTSEQGKITKSSPFGSLESPLNPVQLALAAGATFVARTIDREQKHLGQILKRAASHKGLSFVEVYQNCNIFNDGAYSHLTDAKTKRDSVLILENGQPYTFGSQGEKQLIWNRTRFEISEVNKEARPGADQLLLHSETRLTPAVEAALAGMGGQPGEPTPIGIFRAIEKETYEDLLEDQITGIKQEQGAGDLQELLNSGTTWQVD